MVTLLLNKGAQADLSTRVGGPPLMGASLRGHVGVMRLLLEHTKGQGLDHRTGDGRTALHLAVRGGAAEAVRFLLFAGADPTITDNQGRTPRAEAEQNREEERAVVTDLEPYVDCVMVFQWWEGELERRRALCRALCLHKAYTTQRDQPTSQVPTYLEARVAAGHAVPGVEVVSPQSQEEEGQTGASGKRKAAGETGDEQGAEAEREEERHAVVEYVVKGLNEELLTELLEGFHYVK